VSPRTWPKALHACGEYSGSEACRRRRARSGLRAAAGAPACVSATKYISRWWGVDAPRSAKRRPPAALLHTRRPVLTGTGTRCGWTTAVLRRMMCDTRPPADLRHSKARIAACECTYGETRDWQPSQPTAEADNRRDVRGCMPNVPGSTWGRAANSGGLTLTNSG
jgi:hypothetical protein